MRGNKIYVELTKHLGYFLKYCGVQLPLSQFLDVARLPVCLDIDWDWQIFCSNHDWLKSRNSYISWTILFSLDLFAPHMLTKYVRAVMFSVCRWTVSAYLNFVKIIRSISLFLILGNWYGVIDPPCSTASCHKTLTVGSPTPHCCSIQIYYQIWCMDWNWFSLVQM